MIINFRSKDFDSTIFASLLSADVHLYTALIVTKREKTKVIIFSHREAQKCFLFLVIRFIEARMLDDVIQHNRKL